MKKRMVSLLFSVSILLSFFTLSAAAANNVLVMSNCDTTEGWSATAGGGDALTKDTTNKVEGAASVGATAPNGKLNQIVYMPENPVDVSGYKYLEFDIYFSDMTWFTDCGGVMFEITSSGTCDKESNRFQKGALRPNFENGAIEGKAGWFHIKLNIQEPQSIANGGCTLSQFDYFRFYSVDPITSTPDYTMRIDNVMFTNNEDPQTTTSKTKAPTSATTKSTGAANTSDSQSSAGESTEASLTKVDRTDSTDSQSESTSDSSTTGTDDSKGAATDEPTDGLSGGAIAAIVIGAVVLLGGGFALYWFVIRKKLA